MTDTPHADLLARHRRVMPSWLALYYDEPIELVSGSGRHVVDGEGTRYLDFFGGILTTMTGYDVPEVVDAIRTQAGRMIHTSTLYLIRPMVELAERLAPLSGIPDAKVFFTTSGTEANEAALLLASTARRSNQVLALRNSYHGRSFATVGITGNRGWSASSLTPFTSTTSTPATGFPGPARVDPTRRLHRCRGRRPPRRDPHGHRGRRGLPDRRADPGRGRLHRAARRPVRGHEEGARRVRHPLHQRRGADRVGTHRRPLLGLRGPRPHPRPADLRQGPGQRAVDGGGHRARRADGRR